MTGAAWIVAFALGVWFLASGVMKLIVPHEHGRVRIAWLAEVAPARYRLIGWLETAGAIGLVFPTLVEAFDWLVPIAAFGLALIMVGAARLHLRRREGGYLVLTAALLVGCVFVVVATLA